MMKDGTASNATGSGWILPVARIQEELGMQALYKADAAAVLMWPGGDEIELTKHQGLNFLVWEIFEDIRGQLIQSHLDGRPGSPTYKGDTQPVVQCSHDVCEVETQTVDLDGAPGSGITGSMKKVVEGDATVEEEPVVVNNAATTPGSMPLGLGGPEFEPTAVLP